MKDNEFSYIALIVTLTASVVLAGGITLGGHKAREAIESSTKSGGTLATLFNEPESKVAQEINATPAFSLPSSLSSHSMAVPQYTPTKSSTPAITVRTQRSSITISRVQNENELHEVFSMNIKSLRSNINKILNSRSLIIKGTSPNLPERIAYVAPTFTTAAYNHRFYVFYRMEEKVPLGTNVTTNLNLLTSKVIKLPSQIIKHAFLVSRSNVQVITDQDVDSGSIFTHNNPSSNNKYDVLILGHQEYVTQNEYDNLKHYVENGGSLILLDGNMFYAQVGYDRYNHSITLIKGHGWAFNGKSAWRSVNERWAKETSEWIGSNYLCYSCKVTFANDPWEYKHHEEQYITNRNDTILINYDAAVITKHHTKYNPVIATYELNYKKGHVFVLGLYSEDIFNNVKFDKYFVTLLTRQFSNSLS